MQKYSIRTGVTSEGVERAKLRITAIQNQIQGAYLKQHLSHPLHKVELVCSGAGQKPGPRN